MKNKILKKLTTVFITTALLAGTLAGCGEANTAAAGAADETLAEAEDEKTPENEEADSSAVTTVYAATGGSPKPFTFVNDESELTGHNIELVKAVFEKLPQYELEIEVTDFPSIFAGLDAGRYQIGVNNFASNEERKEKYLFTDPIFANEYVAIFANGNIKIDTVKTWDDLAGLKTISTAGVNMTTAMENYNKANPDTPIQIDYSEADLVLQIQDIQDGKYDFVLMDKPMFEYYQNEFNFNVTGVSIDRNVAKDLMAEPYSYLIVSKGNEQLVEDINTALKEVIEEGASKEINEKWFGSDYSPSYE